MSSKAVILAGGEGTRLLPITESIPKPMVPVAGISAFERIVNLLKNNGINDICVTTMYLAEKIEKIRVRNVDLKYFRESEPLGTAGCVKKILNELDDTFVVINGDDICNFNIKKAMEEHKKNCSDVTVLLYRTSDPTEYGNVILKDGIITGFEEKPSWNRTVSDIINTGIYILNKRVFDYAGDGKLDFSKDLFPSLMKNGIKIHGILCDGFWYDIGDLNSYYNCNFNIAGSINNMIGKNVKAGRRVKASKCIIHDNVSIGDDTILEKCIICEGTVIGKNCVIEEGVVIGADTVIEDNVNVKSNMIVGRGMYVAKGAKVMKNILFNGMRNNIFSDEGIKGAYEREIDGEFCIRLGRALSSIYKKISVMCDGGGRSSHLKEALLCGISGSGGTSCDAGDGFPSLARFIIKEMSLSLSVFISVKDDEAIIKLYDKNGIRISHDAERMIEKNFDQKISSVSDPEKIIKPDTEEIKRTYAKYLISLFNCANKNKSINLNKGNNAADFLYDLDIFSNNSNLGSETIIVLPDTVSAVCDNKDVLSYWHIICIVLKYLKYDNTVSLPVMIPQTVVKYLEELGYECVFYGDSQSYERDEAGANVWMRDPVALAVMLLNISSNENKTLLALKKELPDFYVETQYLEYDDELKAKCMTELSERDGALQLKTGGVKIFGDTGSVIIIPKYEGGFKLFAEAYSVEAANEMFFDVKKMIREIR